MSARQKSAISDSSAPSIATRYGEVRRNGFRPRISPPCRHCEEHLRRSNPACGAKKERVDCFASLAMTAQEYLARPIRSASRNLLQLPEIVPLLYRHSRTGQDIDMKLA